MNLHCNKVELWQTPTYITYMCLMDASGIISSCTGKKAVRALRCYMEWAGSLLPFKVSTTQEEHQANKDFLVTLNKHRKEVEAAFTMKGLEVWLL